MRYRITWRVHDDTFHTEVVEGKSIKHSLGNTGPTYVTVFDWDGEAKFELQLPDQEQVWVESEEE